jgi:hypothetical protein
MIARYFEYLSSARMHTRRNCIKFDMHKGYFVRLFPAKIKSCKKIMCTKIHYVLKFSAKFFIFFFQNFCPGKLLPNLVVKYFPIAIFNNCSGGLMIALICLSLTEIQIWQLPNWSKFLKVTVDVITFFFVRHCQNLRIFSYGF